MTASFGDQFTADEVEQIEIEGTIVHAVVDLEFEESTRLALTRLDVTPARPQGLVLDADDLITVAGTGASRVVWWSDTGPAAIEADVPPGRLSVWNVWRDGDTEQAWIGWAGMLHTESDGALELDCADGHAEDGHPTLSVEIRWASESEPEPAAESESESD